MGALGCWLGGGRFQEEETFGRGRWSEGAGSRVGALVVVPGKFRRRSEWDNVCFQVQMSVLRQLLPSRPSNCAIFSEAWASVGPSSFKETREGVHASQTALAR